MSQLVALQIKPPEFDMAKSLLDAERINQSRQTTESNDMKLTEQRGEHSALEGFRKAKQAGDPNAMSKLTGYPEIQDKIQQHYESITDAGEKRKFKNRVESSVQAALQIAAYPEGDPQRKIVGDQVIDKLVADGHISEEEGGRAKASGYTNLFLSQYLELKDALPRMLPEPKKGGALDDVRVREIESRIAENEANKAKIEKSTLSDEEKNLKIQKLEEENNKLRAQTGSTEALEAQRRSKVRTDDERDAEIGADEALAEQRKASAANSKARTQKTERETNSLDLKDRKIEADISRIESQIANDETKVEGEIVKIENDIRDSLIGNDPSLVGAEDKALIEGKVQKRGEELREHFKNRKAKKPGAAPDAEAKAPGTKKPKVKVGTRYKLKDGTIVTWNGKEWAKSE